MNGAAKVSSMKETSARSLGWLQPGLRQLPSGYANMAPRSEVLAAGTNADGDTSSASRTF
jgi:hypothetical protein